MTRLVPAFVVVMALGNVCLSPAVEDTKVKPVGVTFNTVADEDEPHLADNGLTLYYTVTTKDKDEVRYVKRRFTSQAWPAKGTVLADYIQPKGDVRSVFCTTGRYPHYLYFANKDKEGKNYDLFAAVQQDVGRAWSAPTALANVSTSNDELHPWITSDGKAMYFSRKTTLGSWRVYRSTRTTATGPGGWQKATKVDLPLDYHHATLTPDGKTMYLQGPLDKKRWGLFVATRTAKGWSKPQPLDMLNDTSGKIGDRSPNLSRDGSLLYFASDRKGGKGGMDVYVVKTSLLKKTEKKN